MAVTKIIPRWQDRGAETDEKGVQTLTRGWIVETNDDLTSEQVVIDSVVLVYPTAALYAPHPHWPPAVCRKLRAKPHEGPRNWLVTADYSSAPFAANGDGTGGSNPTSPSAGQSNSAPANERAPTITVGRKEVSKPLEKDAVTGARVLNTLGDPFDPPAEVFRSNHVITAKFFRSPEQLDWANRSKWMDSVNQATVTILGRPYTAATLRCTEYSLDTVWETGPSGMTFLFAITVQAEFNPDGWQPKILNTGRRRKGATSGDPPVAIVDANGQPVTDPVPLDAAGVPVAPGGAYHYVEPKGYVEKQWNGTGGTWTGAGGILA
ncbi:hypothetical protein R5W23_000847 [Gemmata sp. JC673]|uniref:Minor tail protein n=1 Tax=Gemmata algarum TaxID=2975278 RepID=A0ABU5ES07_9BACT|nr:hypothetical protein [Gemmata algarum]MDY3558126.1 hypothetical protein [Gemmata algarum]